MYAHHTRIKFLFNLLFNDLKTKSKEDIKSKYETQKNRINERRRIWGKYVTCWKSSRKSKEKRKSYGSKELNLRFKGSAGHHVDKNNIIYIPLGLHSSCWHSLDDPESMNRINLVAWDCLEAGAL